MVSIVVTVAKNNVIGSKNELLWNLPADLRHSKELTTGQAVIMGRKTFESIVARIGKPLPNRRNIVISRKLKEEYGYKVAKSPKQALDLVGNQSTFIIGGADIFKQTLHLVERIYLTEIDMEAEGDAYFPELDTTVWHEIDRKKHLPDTKNVYGYNFVTLERRPIV